MNNTVNNMNSMVLTMNEMEMTGSGFSFTNMLVGAVGGTLSGMMAGCSAVLLMSNPVGWAVAGTFAAVTAAGAATGTDIGAVVGAFTEDED